MSSLTDVQQAFVHRYMDDNGVLGVRICEIDGQNTLVVDIRDGASPELPDEFRDLPVVVRTGNPAVLAYS
jgi:hypothetical protein